MSQSDIYDYFHVCKETFSEYGMSLNFPKNTDPTKTYKWRYLKTFDKKIKQWDLGKDLARLIIKSAIKYAYESKTLRRGLSILASDKILELAYNDLKNKSDRQEDLIDDIEESKKWVDSRNGLLGLNNRMIPNIVVWYISNRISKNFLSISKSAKHAIGELREEHRSMLPSEFELILARDKIISDLYLKIKVKKIMGKDWA